jgi:uncharacterized membrane protein
MSAPLLAVTLATALGCGVVAGVFFAFSGFVMTGLARAEAPSGIAAMQSINRAAVRAPLMAAMFGTAAGCVALIVWAAASLDEDWAPWALAAGAAYLLGAIAVTIAANVPRNDALEAVDPSAPDAPGRWAGYVRGWTAWNHVRTAAALAAAGALTVAVHVA